MVFYSTTEKIIFYKIPVILFSLIPFFLITGPFLSDFAVSLISILFLIYCYKNKNFSFFQHKYFYFFLFFWVYLVLNSLFNNSNLDSLKIAIFSFRYGVFVIAISALLVFNDKFLKYFFYCIFFCFVILILDGFFQYFNPSEKNIFGLSSGSKGRLSSFFGTELILGSYLVRIWPIFLALSIILFKKEDKFFYILIIIFILSEILIFLSGERTSFFYINFSAIFIILLSNKLSKLRTITLILSLCLLTIISYFEPSAKNRIVNKTLKQMDLFQNEKKNIKGEILIFSDKHTQHYVSAYKMFLDNKVFGVGIKNFRNLCDDKRYYSKYSCSTHPHNTYIQILAETGIIGFLFLITTLFYFIKYIIKHILIKLWKKKYYFSDFEICLLSGISMYLWPFVPTGNIFSNWINIITILNLPLLIWSKKLLIKESKI
jgi:O-antigen ligase